MNNNPFRLLVSPTIGEVSAEFIVPENTRYVMTLAHGAGAGMNHVFMTTLAQALADRGIATLRFNFPFTEQHKRRPDVPAVAQQTVEAAIQHANKLFPAIPLFVAGKSFGGRMTSQLLAVRNIKYVRGIVFYGFPLHPAGKPSVDRAEHLKKVNCAMLFLQGTRDELANMELMEPVASSLKNSTLFKLEGADHSFKAGKQDVISILADKTLEWMDARNGK